MEKLFIRVGLGGCHQTDRPEARSLQTSATPIPAEISAIPCVMAFLCYPAGTGGRTEELDLRPRLWPQQPENPSCAHSKLELLGEPALSWSQDEIRARPLPACSKTTACFAHQLSFLEAFYKESFRFLVYCTHPIRNEAQKMKISVNYPKRFKKLPQQGSCYGE